MSSEFPDPGTDRHRSIVTDPLGAKEERDGQDDFVGRAHAWPRASTWRVAGSQRSFDRLCLAGHVRRDRAQGRGGQAACRLPGRADHQPGSRRPTSVRRDGYRLRAVLHGGRHQPDRARRHRFDDLQPALRSGPALCHAGSSVEGPGRLELRDDGPRRRRPDVRHRQPPGSAAALQPGGRISRRRDQALAKLGAGRAGRRQEEQRVCRRRARSTRSITPARTSRCAGLCPSRARARAGR